MGWKIILILLVVQQALSEQKPNKREASHVPTRHSFAEYHNRVAIPVPQPIPISIPRPVPYPVHIGVPVDQPRPVPVPIPHPVAHFIPRPVAVPIDRPFPYPIAHPVPVTITQGVGIPVPQPYAVGIPSPVPVRVPHPVPVHLSPVAHEFHQVPQTVVSQPYVSHEPQGHHESHTAVESSYSDTLVESHGHEIQHPY